MRKVTSIQICIHEMKTSGTEKKKPLGGGHVRAQPDMSGSWGRAQVYPEHPSTHGMGVEADDLHLSDLINGRTEGNILN